MWAPSRTRMRTAAGGTCSTNEQKVVCPISTAATGTAAAGARAAFANTEDALREAMGGAPATATAPAVDGQYHNALRGGHRLHMIVMETFGGMAPPAVELLESLARKHGAKLGVEAEKAPWCARSFKRLHAMRITIALHCAAASEILQTAQLDAGAEGATGMD